MNILCSACDAIFDAAHALITGRLQPPLRGEFSCLQEWERAAVSSSCHLCAVLFYIRAPSIIEKVVALGQADNLCFEVELLRSGLVGFTMHVDSSERPLNRNILNHVVRITRFEEESAGWSGPKRRNSYSHAQLRDKCCFYDPKKCERYVNVVVGDS